MDDVKELEKLKSREAMLKAQLDALIAKRQKLDTEINEATAKATAVTQEIFQRENVVWLEAAKKVAAERPEFQKMVDAYAAEMQIDHAGRGRGRPKKLK